MVNDISISLIFIGILIFSSLIISNIASEFDQTSQTLDVDSLKSDAQEKAEGVDSLLSITKPLGFFGTLFKLTTWDVGDNLNLPWWLDAFYTLIAIGLLLIIVRNAWIGGGG